jgi:outer membrane protein assembly factor BamB
MKTVIFFLFILPLSFSACGLFTGADGDEEPPYTAKIAWDSGLRSGSYQAHTVYEDNVYFYEPPEGYGDFPQIFSLTKINAETGALVWRSTVLFGGIAYCQPVVIGGYVYVFLQPNVILCFDRETGEHTACVELKKDDMYTALEWNATVHNQNIYMGFYTNDSVFFFRLNVNLINQTGDPDTMQVISPEILWEPAMNRRVPAKPVVYKDVVYTSTWPHINPTTVVELAGFDEKTGNMVFHKTFGGVEDVNANFPFPEIGAGNCGNPIFIHNDVLYYICWSITAWDLNTGKQLYYHNFTRDVPESKTYSASGSLQPVYYKEKIYYTSTESYTPNSYRNIHCINAATGKLVWNAIAKDSMSLDTNPIIANGKLYVSQDSGIRVYKPETGKLIGVDKSFCGMAMGRNVLYKDYMICVRMNRNTGQGRMVAVYVGK